MATHPRHGGETPLAGAGPRPIPPPYICVNACECMHVRARLLPLATVHVDSLVPPATAFRGEIRSLDGRLRPPRSHIFLGS